MRSASILLGLALCVPALGAQAALTGSAGALAEQSNSRPVEGQDLDAVRHYSEGVGRGVLKDELGVDLDALRFRFDPRTLSIETVGASQPQRSGVAPGSSLPTGPHSPVPTSSAPAQHNGFLMSVDQRGDLMRLGRDIRDIPFGVQVKGDLPLLERLTAMETKIWVPFSWRDEFKAEASVPLKSLGLGLDRGLLKDAGLRSDFSNRLGINQVDAGLGTEWATRMTGAMDLNYDYSQRFGQGLDETVHWLKLRKDF